MTNNKHRTQILSPQHQSEYNRPNQEQTFVVQPYGADCLNILSQSSVQTMRRPSNTLILHPMANANNHHRIVCEYMETTGASLHSIWNAFEIVVEPHTSKCFNYLHSPRIPRSDEANIQNAWFPHPPAHEIIAPTDGRRTCFSSLREVQDFPLAPNPEIRCIFM